MKQAILFLLCATLALSCSRGPSPSSLATVTLVDRNGLKETITHEERLLSYDKVDFVSNHPYSEVVRVFKRDAAGNIHSVVTTYHENGEPHHYLEVLNGRACGSYKQWFENGQLALEGRVLEGAAEIDESAVQNWQFDGCCMSWNRCGTLIATIPYHKGLLDGESLYYHDNGALWKRVTFKEGLPEGESLTYTSDGTLLERSFYSEGVRSGTLQRFWREGKIAAEETYKNGALIQAEYFTPTGERSSSVANGYGWKSVCGKEHIAEQWQVQEGKLEGLVKVFSPTGSLLQEYHVKEGRKHGEDTEYYSHGKPQIRVLWVEGVLQGPVTTWYPSGQMESKKELHNNKKQGVLSAWYKDGSLMLVEEYNDDLLQRGEYYSIGSSQPITTVREGEGRATLYDSDGNFRGRIHYKHGAPLM